ncbi:MAG: methyltransferase domain-containing protein [Mariprofundales bacterium]
MNTNKRIRCSQCLPRNVLLQDFSCPECGFEYPRINDILRFVTPDNYATSFGYQWNIHTRTQLDSYSGLTISHDRVFSVTNWPKDMTGQSILEAGSGAGRFTEVLLETGAQVASFDFSTAVEANARNNGNADNLFLFQGDIFNIPFIEGQFDKVFCLGVLQHTPDPELAFMSLAAQVKPGGSLAVDAYTRNMLALMQWKYVLRPFTKRMDKKKLYCFVTKMVDWFIPMAILLRRLAGRAGARLVPIVQYSHLGLSAELNKQWAILDTFDMYSPEHDHPQSLASVRGWFEKVGFINIDVRSGPNGVVGTGVRPK